MRAPAPKTAPAARTPRYAPGEPQKNFTKLPNAYDVLIRDGKLRGSTQRDVIWILARNTWGSEKREEYVSLSLTQIAEKCGGIEKGALSLELKDLAERGIIARESAKACGGETSRYKLTPQNWKAAEAAKKGEPTWKATPGGTAGDSLVVRPGASSPCVRARLTPAGSEPVDFQIAYANMGSAAVEVSSIIEADIVRIVIGDHKAKLHQANASFEDEGFRRRNPKNDNPVTNKELIEKDTARVVRLAFASVVKSILAEWFEADFDEKVRADQKFLDRIFAASSAELTPEYFDTFTREKLRSMKRRNQRIEAGILVWCAEHASKANRLADLRLAEEQERVAELHREPPPAEPLDPSKPWDRAREYMQAMMGEIPYTNWIAYTRQISAGKSSIVVAVPNQATLDYITAELTDVIKAACAYVQVPEKIIWRVEE